MRIRWRGLELPSRVVRDREKLTDTYGKFLVEPFERGFGTPSATACGASCSPAWKAAPSPGSRSRGSSTSSPRSPAGRGLTDIVLNIKCLVVKNHSEQPQDDPDRRATAAGVVTAADILHDESIEIINPDHILAP